jgi:hypothetical protein
MHGRKETCARSPGRKHTEGKRTLERPRRRSGNMKIDFKGIGMGSAHWIHLAQDRDNRRAVMKMAMSLRIP